MELSSPPHQKTGTWTLARFGSIQTRAAHLASGNSSSPAPNHLWTPMKQQCAFKYPQPANHAIKQKENRQNTRYMCVCGCVCDIIYHLSPIGIRNDKKGTLASDNGDVCVCGWLDPFLTPSDRRPVKTLAPRNDGGTRPLVVMGHGDDKRAAAAADSRPNATLRILHVWAMWLLPLSLSLFLFTQPSSPPSFFLRALCLCFGWPVALLCLLGDLAI